jgi:predicted nucleic acid-binding protein
MFLDTSGLLCLIDRRDTQRADAQVYFAVSTNRISHSYVISEFVALAQTRGVPRRLALEYVQAIVETKDIDVVWVSEELHKRAIQLLIERLDKEWSLCDAVSFIIMEERSITEALTTGHYFEQAGFVQLLK